METAAVQELETEGESSVIALIDDSLDAREVVESAGVVGSRVIVLHVTSLDTFERRRQSYAAIPQLWREGGYYLDQATEQGRITATKHGREALMSRGIPFVAVGYVGDRVDGVARSMARYGAETVYLPARRSGRWLRRRDRIAETLRRRLGQNVGVVTVPPSPARSEDGSSTALIDTSPLP